MSYNPFPTAEVSFETLTLQKLELGVRQALSRHMLHGIQGVQAEEILDRMRDQIVYRLRAHVWSDPARDYRKVHKFSYVQAHPTWKHQLTASLPEGSFRRRWCHFFWEIPFDYANTKITETVEVHVPTIFPENTMQYPPELGRAHHPISIRTLDTTREPFYGQF